MKEIIIISGLIDVNIVSENLLLGRSTLRKSDRIPRVNKSIRDRIVIGPEPEEGKGAVGPGLGQ
jgi:hypothetical protein